jgi:hypothetical protein
MKKTLYLVAGLLLAAGSVSAQEKWTNVVADYNGNFENEFDAEKFCCFQSHEWREGEAEQYNGPVTIVEDPTDPTNHVARIIVRSQEVAQAAGNMIEADGNLAGWDSQFFIAAPDTIPVGKEIRVTMRVLATNFPEGDAPNPGTQAHNAPGDYNHYQCIGNIGFGTEWKTLEFETTVTADMAQANAETPKRFQSIAINLADYRLGYIAYFDDIKFQVKDPTPPQQLEGWFNLVRNGDLATEENFQYDYNNPDKPYTFTGRSGVDNVDRPAKIVNDPLDNKPAFTVFCPKSNYTQVDETKDEEGNVTGTTETLKYIRVSADGKKDTVNIDNWNTQFFIATNHIFKTGQKIMLKMDARADQACAIETQIHKKRPGNYLHYELFGNIDLTPEYQTIEKEFTITSNQNGGSTVAFNLNLPKDLDINYYFRNIEVCMNKAEVTDEDRILRSEDIYLPLCDEDNDAGTSGEVDMTNMKEILGISNVKEILSTDCMKLVMQDEEEEMYSKDDLTPTDEFIINAAGYYDVNNEDGQSIGLDEEAVDESKVKFNMTNMGGEQPKSTKVLFSKGGWSYLYNINFLSQKDYDEMLTSIAPQSIKPAAKGKIYNLQGQEVKKAGKGVFIQDGKLFIKK